jgi:hypothetical protein
MTASDYIWSEEEQATTLVSDNTENVWVRLKLRLSEYFLGQQEVVCYICNEKKQI